MIAIFSLQLFYWFLLNSFLVIAIFQLSDDSYMHFYSFLMFALLD